MLVHVFLYRFYLLHPKRIGKKEPDKKIRGGSRKLKCKMDQAIWSWRVVHGEEHPSFPRFYPMIMIIPSNGLLKTNMTMDKTNHLKIFQPPDLSFVLPGDGWCARQRHHLGIGRALSGSVEGANRMERWTERSPWFLSISTSWWFLLW